MNLDKEEIPAEIFDAIEYLSEKSINIFFEKLKQREYERLRTLPDTQLTEVKHRAILLEELGYFLIELKGVAHTRK